MKKIVHIAQSNGGVERYLKTFCKYSRDLYENYLIVSLEYEDSREYLERLGAKVIFIKMSREISVYEDIFAIIQLMKKLKKIKPDFVYCHSSKAGALGRISSKMINIPCIYNPHGWSFDMNVSRKKKNIYILIERILSRITYKLVLISDHEKRIALKCKITREKKMYVIENGIDIDLHTKKNDNSTFLEQLNWNENDIIIGMVGRLTEQKSPKTFIEIAVQLLKKQSKCKFLLVGDGEQKNEIMELISNHHLQDKIFITGWVENPELYISIFDIAVLTSNWEGFGLVIPEYMIQKKPVIASNVGGIKDIIINNETGYLVDNNLPENYVSLILNLIEDEYLRKDILENAYQVAVQRFDFQRVINEHRKIFVLE